MNVLWLASWYPNRTNSFNGDFIERHAKAVAPFVQQLTIIAAAKDETMGYNCSEVVHTKTNNIDTYIIYYGRSHKSDAIEKIFSYRQFMQLHRKLYAKIIAAGGKPDMVHVHVAMKAGLFARELKRKYGIPYVVTEQWTGYFKEARPSIYTQGKLFRFFSKTVLKNASLLLPVSRYLGEIINRDVATVPFKAIPNVVDTGIFFPVQHQVQKALQLVHISVMGYQKNISAMIAALHLYKQEGGEFVLRVFGPPPESLLQQVTELGLNAEIVFMGEVTQDTLAPYLREADALLLYSRYETFGCVLAEANACGVPVIVSDFPVFHEFIAEGVNGTFAAPDNPAALATTIAAFSGNKTQFNREAIAVLARQKFCFDTVGKQIREVYTNITGR